MGLLCVFHFHDAHPHPSETADGNNRISYFQTSSISVRYNQLNIKLSPKLENTASKRGKNKQIRICFSEIFLEGSKETPMTT